MNHKKWVVITTINSPNPRVLEFIELGYKVLVVGDKKTPITWETFDERIVYLNYSHQEETYPALSAIIGSNTYARKNLGYLFALQNGAEIIWETDDDTFPLRNLTDPLSALSMERYFTSEDGVWNPYSHFLPNTNIWPRGYPLERISKSFDPPQLQIENDLSSVDVLQTLVNNEPDVDAIYRLTVNSSPITFPQRDGAVRIKKGITPGNTQSTFWLTKKSFKSIYFPVTVNSRFADILKLYLTQVNNNLLYAGFLVEQFRTPHNYMIDFNDEIEMYKNLDSLCSFVLSQKEGISLTKMYSELTLLGICDSHEIEVLKLFEEELNAIFGS